MEEREPLPPLEAMADASGDDGQNKQEAQEEPMGVPFGWFGITLLINILQYMLLLGISLVILIIIRIFMPASMLNP